MVRNESHIIHVMLLYIEHQLVQHRTSTNKSKYNLSAIGSLSTRFDFLHNLNQILKVVVQTDITGIHNDELSTQTVFLLEGQNLFIALIQWINLVFIDPVVDHNRFRDFLILEAILNRFHQITADCNYKVAAFAAELVEPHHGICDKFALGVANSQHLLRVKVLNVVNVLGVFHPFAPDAQQAAQNRRLRDGKHIIHLSDFESRTHCSKEIGNYVLHTALLIGLTELRNPDSQHFHAVDFFFVILLRFVLIFNSSQVTRHHTDDRDIELIQHTLRQFTEDLPR